jgi:hypothetical protein
MAWRRSCNNTLWMSIVKHFIKNSAQCETGGSCCSVAEDYNILGYKSVSIWQQFMTLWEAVVPPYSVPSSARRAAMQGNKSEGGESGHFHKAPCCLSAQSMTQVPMFTLSVTQHLSPNTNMQLNHAPILASTPWTHPEYISITPTGSPSALSSCHLHICRGVRWRSG